MALAVTLARTLTVHIDVNLFVIVAVKVAVHVTVSLPWTVTATPGVQKKNRELWVLFSTHSSQLLWIEATPQRKHSTIYQITQILKNGSHNSHKVATKSFTSYYAR